MCGIAGFFSKRHSADTRRVTVETMIEHQRHRGPEYQRVVSIGSVTLGHARLKIVDLDERSNQPFVSRNHRYTITFNGEIYNYQYLRKLLLSQGVHCLTTSDTEVLVELYTIYGSGVLAFLEGMYSFAIYDATEETLFCARDPLGEKPFYYATGAAGDFAFSSELSATALVISDRTNINNNALVFFLSAGYVKGPQTLHSNIYQLQPGHFLTIENGQPPKLEQYWSAADSEHIPAKNQSEHIVKFNRQLQQSIISTIPNDVPFAAFLSGGLDSSYIVNTIMKSKQMYHAFETYILDFDNADYSEYPIAQQTALMLGVKLNRVRYSEHSEDLTQIIYSAAREGIGDPSFIPLSMVSKVAKEKFKVLIGGDGGDELLYGYDTYTATRLNAMLGSVSLDYLNLMGRSGNKITRVKKDRNVGFREKMSRFLAYRRHRDNLSSHMSWRTIFGVSEISQLVLSKHQVDPIEWAKRSDRSFLSITDLPEVSDLQKCNLIDYSSWLCDGVLRKLDTALMAHSVEGRSPFLNLELVKSAFMITRQRKMGFFTKKIPLRNELRKSGMGHLLSQRKKGFGLPLNDLLRDDLRSFSADNLLSADSSEFFDMNFLKSLIDGHLANSEELGRELYTVLIAKLSLSYLKELPTVSAAGHPLATIV
jgi:asparagine synthase (glutamine-hydrolysing)